MRMRLCAPAADTRRDFLGVEINAPRQIDVCGFPSRTMGNGDYLPCEFANALSALPVNRDFVTRATVRIQEAKVRIRQRSPD